MDSTVEWVEWFSAHLLRLGWLEGRRNNIEISIILFARCFWCIVNWSLKNNFVLNCTFFSSTSHFNHCLRIWVGSILSGRVKLSYMSRQLTKHIETTSSFSTKPYLLFVVSATIASTKFMKKWMWIGEESWKKDKENERERQRCRCNRPAASRESDNHFVLKEDSF